MLYKNKGITLVALVITIVILIILAVISINAIFGDNGLITSAQKGRKEQEKAEARERLELVLADAFTEKKVTEKYTEEEFLEKHLEEFVYDREKDAEIFNEEGQDLISLNGHVFELDRSVPQLGEYIGEKGNLPPRIRSINVENKTLSEITVSVVTARAEGATLRYSIKKLEEADTSYTQIEEKEELINTFEGLTAPEKYKIRAELIVNGEKIDELTDDVLLGELEEGAIKFGDVTWQGNGMASVTVTTNTSYQLQYLILPEDTEDIPTTGWQNVSNGGTIISIPNKSNVYARLWEGTNVSEYASLTVKDTIKPTINSFEATETTSNSIKVQVNAIDNESGLASTNTYKFYLNDEATAKGTSTDGTYTYENLSGLTSYKLKVEVYDNAGNKEERTIDVTTKELILEDALDISDNQKVYVEIPNPKDEENPILCYVLYNDETNGIQIISVNSVEKVTLGNGNFTTAMNSYNTAITTLNEKAEEYNYFGNEYVEARCVGSNPTNPSAEAGMHTTYFGGTYSGKLRDTDKNYESDYNKMTALGIAGISNSSYYWLASRYVNSYFTDSFFDVRYVYSGVGLRSSNLCGVSSTGTSANSNSHGFRPVFTLKSGIKVTGGSGTSGSPYTLGV